MEAAPVTEATATGAAPVAEAAAAKGKGRWRGTWRTLVSIIGKLLMLDGGSGCGAGAYTRPLFA